MKKILAIPVIVLLCLINSGQALGQPETFDIVKYTPPKDWIKQNKPGLIIFTDVNESKGVYCMLAIYASTPSTGKPQQDFTNEWNDRAINMFGAAAAPKTETQTTAEGWKVVAGIGPIVQDNVTSYLLLTVFSGFGKIMSVLANLNDQSYLAQIDALLESMKLDKTATASIPKNNNNVIKNNTTVMQTNLTTGKIGSMMYKAPDGWREQIFSDGVVFKPLDLPADEHLAIQIMEPLNFSGSLEQALEQSFNEAAAMYKATTMSQAGGSYGKNAVQKSFKGWEYIRGKGGVQVENGTAYKSELGLELFVIKINNRFERVAILESRKYCGGVSRYYASDRISYRNGIEGLLFSLQFTDFNATDLKTGSANGSGIVGLWQGTIQSTGAATGVRLEVFSPIFLTNGQVYFGPKFPTEGLDGLNTRIPPELYPRNWGTYTFSNGSGVLQMPFANIPFRTQGDKLIVTKNQRDWPFYKLNSVDGARFNGTYVMSESYEKIPIITFTADGRFTDNGVIRTLYHENTNCINPGFVPGSGTYEVKNYTVLFSYTDGRKVKIAFLGTDYDKTNPAPPVLRMSFNEDPMRRQ